MNRWRELAGAAVVLLTRLATLPRTPWESDEFLFVDAVRNFDPARYRPHPPGYPLFVGLGKAVNWIVGDPFFSLVALNVAACVIGFVALFAAIRRYTGDGDVALGGSLLFYLSAGMLVHSPLALADATTIAFLALTFRGMAAEKPLAAAVFAAGAIGCRPQIAIALLPALLVYLVQLRSWRRTASFLGVFTAACLLWFVPLTVEAGGAAGLMRYVGHQASYFAAHDAAQSRGAMRIARVAVRFVAHAWGSKVITIPLFLAVLAGLFYGVRRLAAALTFPAPSGRPHGSQSGGKPPHSMAPWVVFTLVHFAFAIAAMDPADGVRYSLPAQMLVATLAAIGLRAGGRALLAAGTIGIAAASFWYASPILLERRAGPSPAAAAAAAIRPLCRSGAVVAWDAGTRPVVESLLPECRSMLLEDAMRTFAGREANVLFVDDGGSRAAEARVYGWPMSDAYGKLTRNVLRQITVDPVRPEERFVTLAGLFPPERNAEGEEWRWLGSRAVVRLPDLGRKTVVLTFHLTPDAPEDHVEVSVNGRRVDVPHGDVRVTIPFAPVVEIRAARTFRPDDVVGNRDARVVSVQLTGLEQR